VFHRSGPIGDVLHTLGLRGILDLAWCRVAVSPPRVAHPLGPIDEPVEQRAPTAHQMDVDSSRGRQRSAELRVPARSDTKANALSATSQRLYDKMPIGVCDDVRRSGVGGEARDHD
jgi:hypothetical protein